jgi:aromatic ring hydroxylase
VERHERDVVDNVGHRHDRGTDYHERLKTWLVDAQERDITLAGALADPKASGGFPVAPIRS